MKLFAPLCSALFMLVTNSTFGGAQEFSPPASGNSSAAANEQALNSSSSEQLFSSGGGGGVSCGPRIRKSWDRMLPQEKELYLRAIEMSMDNGLYIKFVEIHTEQMTTAEAHRTCMFIYWHRLFLLGFENMLRAYGGEFSCITVPYWNYVDHNALFLSGACRSMEDCSPILRELGGSRVGSTQTVDINGTPIQGTCVTARPANHFCESSGLRGNQCARCIPRGDWSGTDFPPTVSVSSLLRQLFSSPTIADVATNIEQGAHNTIHNSLAGAMANLEAPADPIFFSHHATLDLLHTIYYKCVVGNTTPMTLQAKLQDPRQFTQCARRIPLGGRSVDRNVLLPQSSVSVRSGGKTEQALSVFEPINPLDAFFAALPDEYLSFSDVRDIGEFSYNYEITGLLADMYTTCGGLTSLLQPSGLAGLNRNLRSEQSMNSGSLLEAVVIPSETTDNWYREAFEAAVNTTSLTEASNGDAMANALAEVEKMTCVFYDECRGKVRDYSTQFRQNFHQTDSTPCSKILTAIKSGKDQINVPAWRNIFLRHLECVH